MNANELADALIALKGYYGYNEESATMLRQQQNLLDKYHEQALNDSRAISKLVGEMAEKEAEIEALKTKLSLWEQIGRQIANNDNQGTS